MESKSNSTEIPAHRKVAVDVFNYVETPEIIDDAHKRAVKNVSSTNIPEINLSREEIVSTGITFVNGHEKHEPHTHAIVTFLTPAFGHTCPNNTIGLKIYGAYCTEEDAMVDARKIKEYHTELYGKPIYSIIVVEMGKVMQIPTDKNQLNTLITNKKASDDLLNELISNYRVEQEKAQILFDVRKDTLVKAGRELTALEKARQLREAASQAETESSEPEVVATEFAVE